jgi:hypothetical protein
MEPGGEKGRGTPMRIGSAALDVLGAKARVNEMKMAMLKVTVTLQNLDLEFTNLPFMSSSFFHVRVKRCKWTATAYIEGSIFQVFYQESYPKVGKAVGI